MTEEINNLKKKIQELEIKQKQEEEKYKDPLYFLKQRIERNKKLLHKVHETIEYNIKCNPNNYDRKSLEPDINYFIENIECDKQILNMFSKLEERIHKLEKQEKEEIDLLNILD